MRRVILSLLAVAMLAAAPVAPDVCPCDPRKNIPCYCPAGKCECGQACFCRACGFAVSECCTDATKPPTRKPFAVRGPIHIRARDFAALNHRAASADEWAVVQQRADGRLEFAVDVRFESRAEAEQWIEDNRP